MPFHVLVFFGRGLLLTANRLTKCIGELQRQTTEANGQMLCDVLGHEWLYRLWTCQELVLAARPIIVCGTTHVPWPVFVSTTVICAASPTCHALVTQYAKYDQVLPFLEDWQALAYDRDFLDAYGLSDLHRINNRADNTIQSFKEQLSIIHPRYVVNTCAFAILLGLATILLVPGAGTLLPLMVLIALPGVLCLTLAGDKALTMTIHRSSTRSENRQGKLLEAIWKPKCIRSVDYNFAIRGVLQRYLGQKMDYLDSELPQLEIFKDLTRKLLEASAHHLIIDAATISPRIDNKPSWVVD